MGCVISSSGIFPTKEKVEAIKQAAESFPWNDQLSWQVYPKP